MPELNFNPFPKLETPRLNLRAMTMDDAPQLYELRKNTELMRFIDRPLHRSIEDSKAMLQQIMDGTKNNETIAWAITFNNTPEMIGTISYHRIEKENNRAEIGYMLDPQHWRKGIMNEAIKPVLDYGFNVMKLHSIEGNVNPDNISSSNLLKKFGFVREAYFHENHFFNGKYFDTEIYSLLEKNDNRSSTR
jgi:ribosomal-protein-alanine N-acetyltransferase